MPKKQSLQKVYPKWMKGFKVRISIDGEPGTGKSLIANMIWKMLEDKKMPRGMQASEEHVIYTSLKD